MNKILINFAHPAKSRSKINVALIKALKDLEHVTLNDLYANYPDFMIDIKREQRLCEEHDIIIFQHPLYWYQAPSIVKEWLDLVLEYDWAYGSKGNALKGKLFVQAISAGGDESSYQPDGVNSISITELNSPYRALAKQCKMNWIPPYVVLGIRKGLGDDQVRFHAENYRRFIIALIENNINMEKAMEIKDYSTNLDSIIRRS